MSLQCGHTLKIEKHAHCSRNVQSKTDMKNGLLQVDCPKEISIFVKERIGACRLDLWVFCLLCLMPTQLQD